MVFKKPADKAVFPSEPTIHEAAVRADQIAAGRAALPATVEKIINPETLIQHNTEIRKPALKKTRKRLNKEIREILNTETLISGYTGIREGGNNEMRKDVNKSISVSDFKTPQEKADDAEKQHRATFDFPTPLFQAFKSHVAGMPHTSARRVVIRLVREYLKEQGINA
jgi:hypothetical protein